MNVLVLNCGSSSVKFQVIQTDDALIEKDSDLCLAKGLIEMAGPKTMVTYQATGKPSSKENVPIADYRAAIEHILDWIISPQASLEGIKSHSDIHAIGHRVVHGGEKFQDSTLIDDKVLAAVEEFIDLAPLHNPPNLKGIRAAMDVVGPSVPNVAVFDTAFHATMPETSYIYGLPYEYYLRHKIRRYGFHGTSHRYVAYRYQKMLDIPTDKVNIITLHLGNGCSACAIKRGVSVNTSMGFTPLEGLLMGTRTGDMDASILEYIAHKDNMSLHDLDTLCNKKSGLLGISGFTNDMRELLKREAETHDKRARLAIDIFCTRLKRYIGGYLAEMGGADAVIFTGGIGERSSAIRRRVCQGLECLDLLLDTSANDHIGAGEEGLITREDSKLKAYVIPTNEELLIARDTYRVVSGQSAQVR
ncbi:MAG TPA: acetate kinase [Elusimicrobia bacterium]|nr:acetate kinase [Elusimicrobiota bacterium]